VTNQFALIHSPLVGPSTWAPVAEELRRRGRRVEVPELRDDDDSDLPYWRQEVESVSAMLNQMTDRTPLVLVGHSGAGTLLPLIAQSTRRPIAGLLYVDAGLPLAGASRLSEIAISSPEIARQIGEQLALGNRAPSWSDDDLRPAIPNDALRHQVLHELQPRPLAFYEEPIPSPVDWEQMPSGYVLLTRFYRPASERAQELGWSCLELPGSHFQMLNDPSAVAAALISLSDSW